MTILFKWLGLQLFAEGGDGGEGAAATPGETAPDAGETRLRELGVPESVLAKRAKRAKAAPAPRMEQPAPKQEAAQQEQQPTDQQDAAAENPAPEGDNAAPARMSWDEIMADPEYNKQMQSVIKARLKTAGQAEDTLSKLSPALELVARKYGLDGKDPEALAKAISEDDSLYIEKAEEMGMSVAAVKQIEQLRRDNARLQAQNEQSAAQQAFNAHMENLHQQGEALKKTFPSFDLLEELKNPVFSRMTSPNSGLSVEDAYYAIHRKEIQQAAMQAAAQKTAEQMSNAIRSGQARPVENGTQAQAPSVTTFDSASATERTRDFCGLFPLHIAKYAANRCIYSTNLIIPFCAHPFDHIFAHRQRKPPRRGLPSGGVACFLLCRPSAPSLSCLEVGHRALL